MTFLQNELLTKIEIIKSLTETQTTILKALSSFKSNQQCEGNQTNLLTCQKQHKSPPPTPSKQQKPTHHNDKTTLSILNAYKVQIRVHVMAKKQSKFKMYSTLQNKKSNKPQTVRKLKHYI